MAVFIDKFERNLSGLGGDSSASSSSSPLSTSSSLSSRSFCDNDSPVPFGILAAQIIPTDPISTDADSIIKKDKDCKPVRALDPRHRHSSDSGIGSSVSGASMSPSMDPLEQGMSCCLTHIDNIEDSFANHYASTAARKADHSLKGQEAKGASTQSAITKSISSTTTTPPQIPSFGVTARKHIDRFILVPILREKRLSAFHPLIRGVPKRIESKEISCLRDLEKTLLFLAPVSQIRSLENIPDNAHTIHDYLKRYTPSRAAYSAFCEFTIQCLHTTVGYLNERDQRRPSDRPYTNGYFLDLVEQIRQYAAMIGAARERQGPRPRSRTAESNAEYSSYVQLLGNNSTSIPLGSQHALLSDEEVTLEGGLGTTGRPAELVRRKKDSQAISLRTGEPYEEKASPVIPMIKRSLSMESCDDSVTRSMARRKKNAPPLDINQKCNDCEKVFKRPCDLTYVPFPPFVMSNLLFYFC